MSAIQYKTRNEYIFITLLCVLVLTSISAKAWIVEDAFITLRTIAHFFEGYGLRWNIDERVQTYSHPLWLLLHIPLYALTKNMFLTSISLSLFFSTLACAIALIGLRKRISVLLLCTSFIVPLLLSKTFGVFATSGLESPLVFALYAAFSWVLFLWLGGEEKERDKTPPWFLLLFIAALCMSTRLDTALLFLPFFILLVLQNLKRLPWLKIVAGLSPIILWESFSFLYYGVLLPNTKYAKLNGGVPANEYLQQGWYYWLDVMRLDLLSAVCIFFAVILTALWIWRLYKQRDSMSAYLSCIGLGFVCYVAYIFKIGGDHYALRFWAAPLFIALIYINYSIALFEKILRKQLFVGLSAALILIYSIHLALDVKYYGSYDSYHDIVFTHYNQGSGVDGWKYTTRLMIDQFIDYDYWKKAAREFKDEAERAGKPIFKLTGGVGMAGYYAGSQVIFSDTPGLVDPLLARLPSDSLQDGWRIGHVLRTAPKGYGNARMDEDYTMMDSDIAYYYQKIRIITREPVFNIERLKTVIAFNLGLYDEYLKRYVKRCLQERYSQCSSS